MLGGVEDSAGRERNGVIIHLFIPEAGKGSTPSELKMPIDLSPLTGKTLENPRSWGSLAVFIERRTSLASSHSGWEVGGAGGRRGPGRPSAGFSLRHKGLHIVRWSYNSYRELAAQRARRRNREINLIF